MSGYWLGAVLVMSLHWGATAYAFDPFTAAAVVGAGANIVRDVTDAAGEVSATAEAFGELYSEIDADAEISEDGQKLINQVHEIESLASEAGYTKDEIEKLTNDSSSATEARKLSTTLKTLTRAVRAGKHAGRIIIKLDQKAKLSQIEAAQIEREQLVVLYKNLRLQTEHELNDIRNELRQQKDKRDQIAVLKKEEKASGAMVFGKTGVLSFPKTEVVIEEAIKMAMSMRPILFSLMLFVFLARAVFYQFGLFGTPRYGDLVRDAIICAVLMMAFPDLVRAFLTLCNEVAARVGLKEMHEVEPGKIDFPAEIGFTLKTRLLLEWLFQWTKYFAFVTARFLANFGLGFLILLFPIVIFCSQMLNFSIAWPIFLAGFLSVCLWPLFWNATGALAVMLWRKQDASLSDQLATILFAILQFLSPLIGIACLKGQPLSKAIQSAGSTVTGAVTGGASAIASQVTGFAKGAMGSWGGGTVGRALSYPVNQGVGRMIAMGSRGAEAMRSQKGEGAQQTGWKPVLKAAAAGFVTNQAKATEGAGGVGQTLSQVANGLKRKQLIPRAPQTSAKATGGNNVQKN